MRRRRFPICGKLGFLKTQFGPVCRPVPIRPSSSATPSSRRAGVRRAIAILSAPVNACARRLMMASEKPGGHGERCVAVGTLDMALWDAAAKITGVPLCRHLAGSRGALNKINHRNNQWREAERGLEPVGRRGKAPTLPLSQRARPRARGCRKSKAVVGRQGRAVGDRSADPVREKCPHTLRRSDRRR